MEPSPLEVRRSAAFTRWIEALRDVTARAVINRRIDRVSLGNLGDVTPVGEGVSELRVHHGPGYRVYFVRRDERMILLLCGGDKSSQARDISLAKALAKEG